MAITADDINNQSFSIDRRGYDVDEVDVFLEHVADEIDALNNQIAALEAQLDDSSMAGFDTPATQIMEPVEESGAHAAKTEYEDLLAEKDDIIAELEAKLEEKRADDSAISAALIIAQRSADEIIAKANAQADDTIQDARDEAARILNRADNDKQAVMEAIRKLEDEREDVREEYQDILKDFIEDASRKLADLGGVSYVAASTVTAAPVAAHSYVDAQQPQVEVLDAGATGEFEFYDEEEEAEAAYGYVTPQATEAVVAAAQPVASAYEKDLSGFGDADDLDFDEID